MDEQVQRLVDTAQKLEGLARHASTHAAGVVISREPLVEHVPLQRPARGNGDEAAIPMTQFAMEQVAAIGLLKMDFLGLTNLTILDRAAMVALYRPGPMQHIPTYCRAKHGLEEIRYPHPDLAGIMDETYGVIVYQDQVLLIARQFAGYTLGDADTMSKA